MAAGVAASAAAHLDRSLGAHRRRLYGMFPAPLVVIKLQGWKAAAGRRRTTNDSADDSGAPSAAQRHLRRWRGLGFGA